MTEPLHDAGPIGTGWRGFWAWLYPKRIWWVAAAVVVAVIAAFGGLDTVDTKNTYPQVQPGQIFDAGQFEVTVRDARLEPYGSPSTQELRSGTPGAKYLIVEADVRNTSSETAQPQLHSAVDGSGPGLLQAGFAPDKLSDAEEIVRLDYQQSLELSVQPGLTNRYAFVWNMPSTQATLGAELLVQVNEFENRERFGIFEGREWRPGHRHGRYLLTIGDSR